jgi:hypothetical protein
VYTVDRGVVELLTVALTVVVCSDGGGQGNIDFKSFCVRGWQSKPKVWSGRITCPKPNQKNKRNI